VLSVVISARGILKGVTQTSGPPFEYRALKPADGFIKTVSSLTV